MLVTGHSLTIIWLLLDISDCHLSEHEKMLDDIFRSRSNEDWTNAWHKETHVRCRENIQRHLYWACEKDIYKITRSIYKRSFRQVKYPFLDVRKAKMFVRFRRSATRGSSISDECCSGVGCTWEEYAEYCPFNKRIRKYRL